MSTQITGWGMSLPVDIRTNHDLAKLVDTSDEWIQTRTGIRERRVAGAGESTLSLATAAGRQAMERAGVTADAIDMILVATITPDYGFPAVANLVQDELGAKNAAALDINAACTGFISGLAIAHGLIQSGQSQTVLLIGAETMSRIVDWTDRATCVLFGDGAGAVVLQPSEGRGGVVSTMLGSDGAGAELLYQPGGDGQRPGGNPADGPNLLVMDGREVYKFAVRTTARASRETLDRAGLSVDDVDLFIPHQANIRIIDAAVKQLGLDPDKVFTNVESYGNASAASVPMALCEAVEAGRVRPGDRVLMVAFGGGLSWGGALVEWRPA
ncbi:MAG: beta-ketoacyl-ACP synthase III [Chloroflexota bacterium]|nr:beta-ketoacyl-ACP synthase III [Chloroflexota bacterium]MDP6756953.1 beta-ketoacyl-ACP synthase III [Chloroflexota bacterium]